MRNECAEAVNQAAGRELTKEELDGIESRIRMALRGMSRNSPDDFAKMSPAARVSKAAELAKRWMIEDAVRGHENSIEHAAKVAQLTEFRDRLKPGLQGRVAAVMQQAFHRAGAWIGDTSVEKNREAVQNHYLAQLDDVSNFGQKGWGFTMDLTKQQALMRELYGENSGDAQAKKYAGTIKDVLTRLNQHAALSGVGVHELEGWNVPQPTDWTKVGGDSEAWVNANINRVDRNAYVNADGTRQTMGELGATLKAVHETLATNGANGRAEEEMPNLPGIAGSKRNQTRNLFFKDAQSYIDYMHDYGSSNNVYSLIRSVVQRASTDIALSDTYGRNAEANFSMHLEQAFTDDRKAVTGEGNLRKLDSMRRAAEQQFEVLMRGEGTGNALWANRMASARAYVSAVKLGGGVLSALTDPGMVMLNARVNGISPLKAMGHTIKTLFPGHEQRAAQDAGLLLHGIQAANNRFGLEDLGGRVPRFMAQAIHHLSGLSVLDSGIRGGVALSLMDTLGRITRDADFAAAKGDHGYLLNAHGVDQRIWDTWHAAELDKGPDGSANLLTPKNIFAVPDAAMRPVVRDALAAKSEVYQKAIARLQDKPDYQAEFEKQFGKLEANEMQRARTDAAMKLMATVLTEQQVGARGASGQTIGDKSAMGMLKNQKGTFSGEMFRTLMHLKSVPVGILREHWQQSAGLGNPNMASIDSRFGTMRSAWTYRARYAAYSMLVGALSYQLKGIARGENPEDMTDPLFALKAAVAGGGLGMYGDLLLQDPMTKAQDLGAFILGPAAGAVNDAYKIYTSSLHDQAVDGKYNYGAHVLSFVRSDLTPMMNIWYLKAAFNHAVYQQLQETLNPGYTARSVRNATKQGKSFWWQPGESTPSSAPDLSTAVGAG